MVKRAGLFAVLIGSAAAWFAAAQKPAPVPPQVPATTSTDAAAARPAADGAVPLTAADLSSWLDGYFEGTLKPGKIAGAQIVVVKDGQILFKKGYGYADVATKKPMSPDDTLMRIGSTSKLFTWTAVMQQVQAGKIDLNADVNRYLDFKVASKGNRPITMTDLMTHRGGFEEGLKDLLASDPKYFKTTEQYLKENTRPMLFPAGEVPAYSNYGAALAGYIVQRVSGEPFDAYVERHIFAPLRMQHTTFRQPLPPALAGMLSKGYRQSDARPESFELVTTAPAGSVSASGADMAHFMIAQLQQGQYEGASILNPATTAEMHQPSIPARPGFDTLAHGFFYGVRNGLVVIGHGGDTQVFHSDLNLLPQKGVGVFVSFNSRGERNSVYEVRSRLWDLFLDRYFPAPKAPMPAAVPTAAQDAAALAGNYESSRRVEHGFISLFYLLQQEKVSANPDGTITLGSGDGKKFREIAPNLWREVDGTHLLAVTEIEGRRSIVDSDNPIAVLQAVPLARNSTFFTTIVGLSVLGLLLTVLLWPLRFWVRRTYKLPTALTKRALLVQRLARAAAVADLLYIAGWYTIVSPILQTKVDIYNAGLDGLVRTMQIAFFVAVAAAVIGLINVWLAFKESRPWGARVRSVLLAACLIGVVWAAWMGGLSSFTLDY